MIIGIDFKQGALVHDLTMPRNGTHEFGTRVKPEHMCFGAGEAAVDRLIVRAFIHAEEERA